MVLPRSRMYIYLRSGYMKEKYTMIKIPLLFYEVLAERLGVKCGWFSSRYNRWAESICEYGDLPETNQFRRCGSMVPT
jgi:hypothetical protein